MQDTPKKSLPPAFSGTNIPKKEGKIRMDDDTPKPKALAQPQPLQEWEQANIKMALATEDEKDEKKLSKPVTSPAPTSLLPTGMRQIDTPNDHNCLFWSAALGLLVPLVQGETDIDKNRFRTMYERLFGTSGTITLKDSTKPLEINAESTREGIRLALKTYDFSKDDPLRFVGNPLYYLIAEVFRRKVVTQLWKTFPDKEKRTAIAVEYGGNWENYIDKMLKPSSSWGWGGESEIQAISQLVGLNITVHGTGKGYPYFRPDPPISTQDTLHLVHTSAAGTSSTIKNHYHYGVMNTIYSAHLKKDDKKNVPHKISGTQPAVTMTLAPISDTPIPSSGTTPPQEIKTERDKKGIRYPLLKQRLQTAYRDKDTLPLPLSSKPFPIQAVSLTLNEKAKQEKHEHKLKTKNPLEDKRLDQKTETRSQRQNQLQRDENWYHIEQPLEIKALFTTKKSEKPAEIPLQSKPIRRVLVEGRAGSGKTTFSQYLAWQWAAHGLFNTDYDYVLWIPLRHLLTGKAIANLSEELAAFMYEYYFRTETTRERLDELEAILSAEYGSRTLLILDGFDEVAHYLNEPDLPHGKLLLAALQFQQVIVTTRDYQLPPAHIHFDRYLVNIGFTDVQINDYLRHYAHWLSQAISSSPKEEKEVESSSFKALIDNKLATALRQNLRLWNLAHVPLNLALIAEAYGDGLAEQKDSYNPAAISDISLTSLYQKVLECFLLRQLEKQGIQLKVCDWKILQSHKFVVLDILSLLAWEAFQTDVIVLSASTQKTVMAQLKQRYPQLTDIKADVMEALALGLLRSEGVPRQDWLNQSYYFIHLTFQEYFTAYYLLQNLQGYYGERAYEGCIRWITQHKYEPRYQVVMRFLAGLTVQPGYDQALGAFWHALLSPPYDILGTFQVRLIMHCLEEAQLDERIPEREALLNMVQQWGNTEVAVVDRLFVDTLHACSRVISHTGIVSIWVKKLQDKGDERFVTQALKNIGKAAPTTKGLVTGLLQVLQIKDISVRTTAMEALDSIGKTTPSTKGLVTGLLQVLQWEDTGLDVREAAVEVLRSIGKLAPTTVGLVRGLVQVLQGKDMYVSSGVQGRIAEVLGEIGAAAPGMEGLVTGLLQALQKMRAQVFPDEDVVAAAVKALGKIGVVASSTEGLVTGLLQALPAREAVKALGKIGVLAPTTKGLVTGLLQALQDRNGPAYGAKEALGKIGGAAPTTEGLVTGLLQALQNKNNDVRAAAVYALGKIGASAPTTKDLVTALVKTLQDKKINVQVAAVKALGQIGVTAPNTEGLLIALFQVLQGEDSSSVRVAALKALYEIYYKTSHKMEGFVTALVKALQDKNRDVRTAAVAALGEIGMADKIGVTDPDPSTENLITGLLQTLQDEDGRVRTAAVKFLGSIGEIPPSKEGLVTGLLQVLQDEAVYVRAAAVTALDKIGVADPSTEGLVIGLLQALRDKNKHVRTAAVEVLGSIGEAAISTEGLVTGLLQALQDKDSLVRKAAVEALDKIGEAAPSTEGLVTGLLQALQDKDSLVRKAAVKALGKIGETALSTESLVIQLLQTLQDKDKNVRREAVTALGNISKAVPTTKDLVTGLLQALQDKDQNVRAAAVKALSNIGTEAPSTLGLVTSLLKTLQNKNKYARTAAVKVLGEIGTVAPTTNGLITGLFQAYKDSSVRTVAENALSNIFNTQLPLLFTVYFKFSSEAEYNFEKIDSAWQQFIIKYLTKNLPCVALQDDNLQFIQGTQVVTIKADLKGMELLLVALKEKYQAEGLPLSLPMVGERGKSQPHYSAAKKPVFKSVALPAISITSRGEKESSEPLVSVPEEKLSRGERLKARFKVTNPVAPVSEPEHSMLLPELETPVPQISSPVQMEVEEQNRTPKRKSHPSSISENKLSHPITPKEWQQHLRKIRETKSGRISNAQTNCDPLLNSMVIGIAEQRFVPAPSRARAEDRYYFTFEFAVRTCGPRNSKCYLTIQDKSTFYIGKGLYQWLEPPHQAVINLRDNPDAPKEGIFITADIEEETFPVEVVPRMDLEERLRKLAREHGGWVLIGLGLSRVVSLSSNTLEARETAEEKLRGKPGHFCGVYVVTPEFNAQHGHLLKDSELITFLEPQAIRPSSHERCTAHRLEDLYSIVSEQTEDLERNIFDHHFSLLVLYSRYKMEDKIKKKRFKEEEIPSPSPMTALPIPENKETPPIAPPTSPRLIDGPGLFAPAHESLSPSPLPKSILTWQQELQRLCHDHGYTFSLRRIQSNTLYIQFTAINSVFEDENEIKKELFTLGKALKTAMTDQSIVLKPNQFEPDWKQWTLTINADAATLNKIIQCLIQAGASYLPADARSKLGFFSPPPSTSQQPATSDSETPEVACRMQ